MMRYFIILCAFLTSCSHPTSARVEFGGGAPVLLADYLNNAGSGKPLNVLYTELSINTLVTSSNSFDFSYNIGTLSLLPFRHENSDYFGVFVGPEVTFTQLGCIKPFTLFDLGLGFIDGKWKHQGTSFNFWLSMLLGVKIPLDDNLSLFGGYRWVHVSNSGIHMENAGYNADLITLGLEYSF